MVDKLHKLRKHDPSLSPQPPPNSSELQRAVLHQSTKPAARNSPDDHNSTLCNSSRESETDHRKDRVHRSGSSNTVQSSLSYPPHRQRRPQPKLKERLPASTGCGGTLTHTPHLGTGPLPRAVAALCRARRAGSARRLSAVALYFPRGAQVARLPPPRSLQHTTKQGRRKSESERRVRVRFRPGAAQSQVEQRGGGCS